MQTMRSALLGLGIGAALLFVLTGCSPKEDPSNVTASSTGGTQTIEPAKPPVETHPTSTDAGDPMAGAKALVEKAHNTKNFSDMAELFTNESAAAFALPVSMMLSLVAGMGDAFSNMGDSLAKMGSEKSPQSEKAKKDMENIKKMSADLKAFNKKYGLDTLSPTDKPNDAKIKELTKNGRGMLKELGTIMETSGKESGNMSPTNDFLSVDEIDFKVLSPTEVKLTPKDPKKSKSLPPTATAKFEDGAWRLSLGTFDEIMKEMKTQSSGSMSSPGSGMGATP